MRSRPLRIGVVNQETWDFLEDLYERLSRRHTMATFKVAHTRLPFLRERLNRRRLNGDLDRFLRSQDVTLFEWASELLAIATHRPKTSPIVARLHRYELYQWADRINWDAVDCLILVSEAKRRDFVARFPSQAHKAIVVPGSVSLTRFPFARLASRSTTLGTLCHLTPRKRVYDLILALAPLLRSRRELTLRIAGDPQDHYADYYDAIGKLVTRLRLGDQVSLDGPCTDTSTWYQGVDVFISHSYSEGLQVAPMEAMATGCYTLTHDWDGADELLPDDCRYLTSVELVSRIEQFIALPREEQDQARQRMRAIVTARFDADRCAERIEAILRTNARASA